MRKKQKRFTWGDVKRIVNSLPPKQLKKTVTIWMNGEEAANIVTGIDILEEDYINDGDVGCASRSDLADAVEEWKRDDPEWEEEVVYEKGTPIINAE